MFERRYARIKRYREIVEVLIKYGFGYIVDRFSFSPFRSLREKIFGPRILKEELRKLTEAERLRLALIELGPTFIKLGQILSTRYDLLPEEFLNELSKLQDEVPPFKFTDVKKEVEKELHGRIEDTYLFFEKIPVAAASIGQVHKARLLNGDDVAVKVKRPGIDIKIEIDLDILKSLAYLAERRIKESRTLNPVGLYEEFARVIRKELDYTNEALNADKFHSNFRNYKGIKIPKVYWKYTTKSVFTMEYVHGIKISDIKEMDKMSLDRREIARNLTNAYLKQIFIDHYFHGDPHPGNIFVMNDGTLVFLDFGMAKYLDKSVMENLTAYFIGLRQNDIEAIIRTIVDMGLVSTVTPSLKAELEDMVDRYYKISIRYIDPGSILKELIHILVHHHGRIPSNIMLLSKALMQLDDNCRKLDPDYKFGEYTEHFVNRMIKQRKSPAYLWKEASDTLRDSYGMFRKFPRRLDNILSLFEKGTVRLEFEHHGLDRLVNELNAFGIKISLSLILSAVVVASAMIIQFNIGPMIWGLSLLGILGFAIAGVIGVVFFLLLLGMREM